MGVLVFLIGVTLTTTIVQNIDLIMKKYNKIHSQFNEEESLNHFFGTLERFNDNI